MSRPQLSMAPFEGVPLAPPGVNYQDLMEFIEETRESLKQRFPHSNISPNMLAVMVRLRAQKELEEMSDAQVAHQLQQGGIEMGEEELAMEGVIHDEAAINDSLQHGFEGQD